MNLQTTITITNLRLRTVIGIFDWERKIKQDIVIQVKIGIEGADAAQEDCFEKTVDYKELCKEIVDHIENAEYHLIEKIGYEVLRIVFKRDRARWAEIVVDKPHALRFADSVSVTVSAQK